MRRSVELTLKNVKVAGITGIQEEQILAARRNGNTIKFVAELDGSHLSVAPREVPLNSFLGGCTGWEMGIVIESDLYGVYSLKILEREPIPTAASMLRDAVHIFQNMK
ncbi:MAG: hypothetical protein GY875_24055 [Gammaproteobacteria bacterium]|nr:hypothetical protein [Gammaproteobacteria bacterium]